MSIEKRLQKYINLEKTGEFQYGRTLDRMRKVLDVVGWKKTPFKVITVAGSKGKGSVAEMAAQILHDQKLNVGFFKSPHLVTWHERIEVNRNHISEEKANTLLDQIESKISEDFEEGAQPTYFEIVTCMALLYFAESKVDVAMLEVGLGGTFDATNVCDAEVCAITPIGFEHQKVLGESLKEIAQEKSGVIKLRSDVFTIEQSQDVIDVFKDKCKKSNAKLCILKKESVSIKNLRPDGQDVTIVDNGCSIQFDLPLIGKHQAENSLIAYHLSKHYLVKNSIVLDLGLLKKSFERLPSSGRLEKISSQPDIILDGAHTKESAEVLVESIRRHFYFKRAHIVISMLSDKNANSFFEALTKLPLGEVVVVPISSYRSMDPKDLLDAASKNGVEAYIEKSPQEAMTKLKATVDKEDIIIVTGSLYLVGEIKKYVSTELVS